MLLLMGALPLAAIAASRSGDGSGLQTFASKGGAKKPKANEHFETTISNVTATSLTVKEGPNQKTMTITPFTEITLNGQKVSVAALQPGMFVSFVLTDATRLSRITATSK